ncbi:hypothetical protein A2276_04570 [candidate division WOR-1 bacterium RIFOXYA12_FULL_43_27]|uniref:V-type ATP synthase subunit E n=1 Tax=candidate division WOR-1 bacterium RIFOXYC2_FULL_46_14 TaxID=1802587 RepID=A0A1F4U421_UNCSA|nr:MAG: hypothetical protein A2276_04570 [candidate division WOR-1 bacterium RIFOXYA12_FULL_43_27]OGC18900.1 MAG: hypothetical protein A2292_08265 [candidate division WOR-1 bacterium RIFOXYB2_FULL_46_45]OGC29041.1 MAG: hypothetical protein A2232_03330 [candidate division WOR-1 bacterium RIFOXYA2_FULL_46_56]OGC39662.1 MAG: hypothetical protein A2438_06720 [candidate division WOR-1 bacterium RIFOXYC2_FULL_46_14]
MGIGEIEKKILEQAGKEAAKIEAEAGEALARLNEAHRKKLEEMKADAAKENRVKIKALAHSVLVPARLSAKRALLEEKQKIMGAIYLEIGEEKKIGRAELNLIREKSEIKAAEILFR